MIRNLIPSFIFLLLINACSKDPLTPHEPGNEEKQLLSLTVDGFSQSLLPFADRIQAANLSASLLPVALSSSSTNLSDNINTLEFKVYHKNKLIDSLRQHSNDSDFGKYENYLPPDGTPYRVFVVGAMLDIDNGGDIQLKRGATTDETNIKILPELVDAFSFHNSYLIEAESQTENIQLKRFVGRLEINLTEEIPHNAEYIEITIHNTAQFFRPFSEDGSSPVSGEGEGSTSHNTFKKVFIKPEDRGRKDYSVYMYFILKSKLGSEAEITNVTIRAVSDLGQKIEIREINDVTFQANMRTELKGKIFTFHPNRQFEVELNSEWNLDIPEFGF